MVIRGLLHHIVSRREEHGLVQKIDLCKELEFLKKKSGKAGSKGGPEPARLLIDLRGFIGWIYPKILAWQSNGSKIPQHVLSISGGNYDVVSDAVSNFIEAIKLTGFELDFFVDTDGGCSIRDAFPDRVDLWRRRNARLRQVNGSVKEWADGKRSASHAPSDIIPPLLLDQVIASVKKKKVKVIVDNHYRSSPMNIIAWENGQKKFLYYAVVSNNTDYTVMKTCPRFIPFVFIDFYDKIKNFPVQRAPKHLKELWIGFTNNDRICKDLKLGHEWHNNNNNQKDGGKGDRGEEKMWWHPHLLVELSMLIGTDITFPLFTKKGLWKKLDIPAPTLLDVSKWMRDIIYQGKMRWHSTYLEQLHPEIGKLAKEDPEFAGVLKLTRSIYSHANDYLEQDFTDLCRIREGSGKEVPMKPQLFLNNMQLENQITNCELPFTTVTLAKSACAFYPTVLEDPRSDDPGCQELLQLFRYVVSKVFGGSFVKEFHGMSDGEKVNLGSTNSCPDLMQLNSMPKQTKLEIFGLLSACRLEKYKYEQKNAKIKGRKVEAFSVDNFVRDVFLKAAEAARVRVVGANGWVQYFDLKTQKPYYYNTGTQNTVWEEPNNFRSPSQSSIEDVTSRMSADAKEFVPGASFAEAAKNNKADEMSAAELELDSLNDFAIALDIHPVIYHSLAHLLSFNVTTSDELSASIRKHELESILLTLWLTAEKRNFFVSKDNSKREFNKFVPKHRERLLKAWKDLTSKSEFTPNIRGVSLASWWQTTFAAVRDLARSFGLDEPDHFDPKEIFNGSLFQAIYHGGAYEKWDLKISESQNDDEKYCGAYNSLGEARHKATTEKDFVKFKKKFLDNMPKLLKNFADVPKNQNDWWDKKHKKEEKKADLLPIDHHKEKIIGHIVKHRITCIQGETGCGKSTRVPVMLYEDWKDRGGEKSGEKLKILVTQPRRLACISLANRVASCCNEKIGKTIGYQISGDNVVKRDTRIVFMTTGYLLQVVVNDPGRLKEFTHVVLDEVHESCCPDTLFISSL
eukprot:gene506-599_t